MNSRHFLSCTVAAAVAALAFDAAAQAPAPPAPPGAVPPPPPRAFAPPAASYNASPAETRGIVQRFMLTPIGELDGVILADGTEIHLPPHLTTQLAGAVRMGDTVTVQGYRSPSVPLVVATSITDTNTGQTVVDTGPPPPGFRPPPPPPGMPAPGAQQVSLQGKVQRPLYGPAGDINGALLEDGSIVRLPPPAAYQFASLLSPGQMLAVQGWGLTTAYGRVVDVQSAGPSPNQLTQVAPPPPPGVGTPPPAAPWQAPPR
jgi:hypothetical protein